MSSNKKELMALVEDLESEMLKTVSKRREYNTKIMNNYRKTLDLKFDNLKNTKFIVEDSPSLQNEKPQSKDGNQNIMSLIEKPRKLNVSLVKGIHEKRKHINEALQLLKTIEESKTKRTVE